MVKSTSEKIKVEHNFYNARFICWFALSLIVTCVMPANLFDYLFIGVFPEGTQGPLIYDYGFCTSGFISRPLYEQCINQNLTLQAIDNEFMSLMPSVPFSFIQSKVDNIQISFYESVGRTFGIPSRVTPEEFYNLTNIVFEVFICALISYCSLG